MDELQRRIAYRFFDLALLERALTHSSFSADHYERLEFLGDSVLGCVIAETLYTRFAELPEGQLTRVRAHLVRAETLHRCALEIGLDGCLRLGATERRDDQPYRPSILADSLEALFGAIFVDGGYGAAKQSILAVFGDRLRGLDEEALHKDAKTRLQELLQGRGLGLPSYRVLRIHGAAHQQTFDVECSVEALDLRGSGSGTSRRRAEQVAATDLLRRIGS